MKKTKIFALLLALLMVATMVAACSPDVDTSKDPSSDPSGDTSSNGAGTTGTNTIIIGNSTDLSGLFRYSSFGVASPGAADQDVETLTRELGTVVADKTGNYVWNPTVVKSHTEIVNDDGSKTFEVEIYDDLKFSDGSAVTVKDYIVRILVFSTAVGTEAADDDMMAGYSFVGYSDFAKYVGGEEGTKEFSGVRMLSDYKFSVTVSADNIPYYYDITYPAFNADYAAMWIGDAEIKDDGNGCYLTESFYEKDGKSYKMAHKIVETAHNTDTTYPYSGPYYVESYDSASKTAVLKKNDNYKGNYEGTKPSIGTIVYKKVVSETQLEDLKSGGVDILMGINGGDATDEAIALKNGSDGKYDAIHYNRAGYGKLGFNSSFGSTQFVAVRHAIAYCLNRSDFASKFTGGYGGTVDGPYYKDYWAYQAVSGSMKLEGYSLDKDQAITLLVADGWTYDKDGNEYTTGVRYKQIAASEIKEADKTFQSIDGKYKTTQVGDYYYIPLVINWYGTTENEFSDLLITEFVNSSNLEAAGFEIQYTLGDFYTMLSEQKQKNYSSGVYGGTPLYNAFNYATGYNSAVYDYAYNLSVDPAFSAYSAYYIQDAADIIYADGTAASGYYKVDGMTYGEDGDYISLYDKYGAGITVADVKTSDKTGEAYIEIDGKQYILGLDFLTMAMVYNCGDGELAEQQAAYATWWKLYMERWNLLLPELPLYSDEYYDVYNTKIQGVQEHPTNPLWGVENALIDWSIAD